MEILKGVPNWFLFVVIFLMGGGISIFFAYFLWSIRGILTDIKDNTAKLFERYEDHETRLSRLEGKCDTNHG